MAKSEINVEPNLDKWAKALDILAVHVAALASDLRELDSGSVKGRMIAEDARQRAERFH